VITSAWALKDKKQLRKMVSTVLRITVMVALPAGLGLSVLAKPILNLIYEPHNVVVAGPQLQVLGLAVVFICLVAPINAMLQAIGRADVPAKIVLVGGAVKLVLNVLLIQNPYINIMGSAYSTFACYIVMVVLSLYSLFKVVKARIYWKSAFLKPLIASILCIAAAWAANGLLARVISAKLAVVIAIAAAVIVYLLALLWIKAIKREDVLMLPKGQKIAQILEKYDWIG
jgi:stage V sporulation protein B